MRVTVDGQDFSDSTMSKMIVPEQTQSQKTLTLLRSFQITDPASDAMAKDLLQRVKGEFKRLEEKRKSFTGPLTDTVRNLNAFFKPATAPLLEAEDLLKAKISGYARSQEQTRVQAMVLAQPVPPPAQPDPGVSIRQVRRFRITDPDVVPRQFCSPDPQKIQDHLRNGGLEAIKGVEFYTEDVVYSGSK